jgi:hypothetical protein
MLQVSLGLQRTALQGESLGTLIKV